MHINTKGHAIGCCKRCAPKKNPDYYIEKKCLPVWYKDGVPQFHRPQCLIDLTFAEKMLIQKVSPFVPLHHLKQGVFGLKGHVCAFEQKIDEWVTSLPRKHDSVTTLKVLQTIRAEIGSDRPSQRAFLVRKKNVFEALEFLAEYSNEYKDIKIERHHLDWIEGDEGYLEGHEIHTEEVSTQEDQNSKTADMGPAHQQTNDPTAQCDNVGTFGYIDEGGNGLISQTDQDITEGLQDTIQKSGRMQDMTVDWPTVEDKAVNEYGNKRIFALAFPWLFPGGLGDVKDFNGDMKEWGKMMLYYEDGRFASDKIFCFFAMNYIIRHRNGSSGRYFVNTFHNNCPDTLEELQEEIQKGNSSFVNSLTYYTKRIKGSTPYWNQKRSEVYAWINHQVNEGNGAPSFFITLSCAEYFWADVIELLRDRLTVAGIDPSDCYVGSKKLVQIANDYSIVIQEYFQARVKLWLDTVGAKVFGIKHYWVRYEFAPGRGQIHAHLLAITADQAHYEHAYHLSRQDGGEKLRADYLSAWASAKFGLTASTGDGFDERQVDKENTPVRIRFSDVTGGDQGVHDDGQNLLRFCQYHTCSGFCLKKSEKR